MIQWFKKVVFENYANFKGRARRSEYWYFFLTQFLITIVCYILFGVFAAMDNLGVGMIFYAIAMLFSLATMIPGLAVGVRRMHDVGKSGWFLLVPIYSLILALTEGEKGANAWGEDPKAVLNEVNEIGNE
ncbi:MULTISPECIES: DUF805 domain-containing protein [unclassified Flavobacterium]|uniref:DUF805 domain-containing protein n=1 Tax=unclassified Flavobacterium TaxID=196869 RepID=UPI00360AD353